MNDWLKMIYEKLLTIHTRVYQEEAPQIDPATGEPPIFPYVVFKIPTITPMFVRDDIILEVTIWGDNKDTTVIENLTDSIDNALNRYLYYEPGVISTRLYRIGRLAIPDPDERLRRRELRYICKTFM